LTSPDPSGRQHLSAVELERLFLAEDPWPGNRSVSHLLEDCPICSERASAIWARWSSAALVAGGDSPASAAACGDLDAIIARVLPKVRSAQTDFAAECAEAKRLLPRLLAHPLQRQLMLVSNSRRYHTWALCELLLEQAWSQRFKDPRQTEALARLAIAVSEELPEHRYGTELSRDLRARCWIGLANGRRILGEFREAASALEEARKLLEGGTGSLLEKAHWHDLRASLRRALGELRAAERDIGFAAKIYYETGQRHALGTALIKRAAISEELGEVERSIVLGKAGVELVDAERDPSVLLVGWLNLIRSLHSLGRHRDALAALGRARPVYAVSGDRTTFLRFQWLEGSIAAALGRDDQAEGCLRETRDGFIELEIVLDAAVVCLDLALVLSRQGRNAEVITLATEMIAIFEARGTRTEALTALILLQQAAKRESLSQKVLEGLRSRLGRAKA
jgi:tetratricopeptide (TPR) repeat protein